MADYTNPNELFRRNGNYQSTQFGEIMHRLLASQTMIDNLAIGHESEGVEELVD